MKTKWIIFIVILIAIVSVSYWIIIKDDSGEVTNNNEENNSIDTTENINDENVNDSQVISDTKPEEDLLGLIAHWTFDEDSGDIIDSVKGHTGVIKGDLGRTEGKAGSALYFDGVDDYVHLSEESLAEVSSLAQGTIAFWFKYSSVLNQQPIMPIFYIGIDSTEEEDNMLVVEIGHSNTQSEEYTLDPVNKKLYITWVKEGQEPVLCFDSNENVEEDEWHHFALVVGPDGNIGYLNGEEMVNRNYNFCSAEDQMVTDSIPIKNLFSFGYGKTHHYISPEFVYFKGFIDDVRIFDQPMASSEVVRLVNN
ncbi:LamG domain-containing protein [Patescibacteria group bacterium]|nr:LamG domain-containing protein [Patescibacteria group bacterium]